MITIINKFNSATFSRVTYANIIKHLRKNYTVLDHTFDANYNISVEMTEESEVAYRLKYGNDSDLLFEEVKMFKVLS